MDGSDVGGRWLVFAHRDVEVKEVEFDNKSSSFAVLMGIVGGAAKVRVQKSSRTASQNLPKCCIMAESAVACSGSTAQKAAEPEDWETACLSMRFYPCRLITSQIRDAICGDIPKHRFLE